MKKAKMDHDFEEPLLFMDLDSWPAIQKAFLADLPRSISGYNLLETQKQWKANGCDYEFKAYCPNGDVNSGFVGMNIKETMCEIIILCPNDSMSVLEEALKKTKIIDWEERILMAFVADNVIPCIKNVVKHKNLKFSQLPIDTFGKKKELSLFSDVTLPPDINFDLLKLDHIQLIDCKWEYRHSTSAWHFRQLIKSNSGYGLYKNNDLITWIFISETGFFAHLYTLEEHRRNGYAELIVKLVFNNVVKDGETICAYFTKENVNMRKLYEKLGFAKLDDVSWCFIRKE